MKENNQITIKKIIKLELQLLLFIILFLVIAILLIGNLSMLKEMFPVFLYMIPSILLMFLIGGFISYKKRNDKAFPEKILILQSPLIMIILSISGIKFDESNPKEFYFYYNLFFGIFLIILGFILFFATNNFRIGLIPFIFGIIIIS